MVAIIKRYSKLFFLILFLTLNQGIIYERVQGEEWRASFGQNLQHAEQKLDQWRTSAADFIVETTESQCHYSAFDKTQNSLNLLESVNDCGLVQNSTSQKKDFNQIADRVFEQWAAQDQIKEFQCRNKTMIVGLQDAEFKKNVVNDINSKLEGIRLANDCINSLSKGQAQLVVTNFLVLTEQMERLTCKGQNITSWLSYKLNLAKSIWSGSHPLMLQSIQDWAAQPNLKITVKDLEDAVSGAIESNTLSMQTLKNQLQDQGQLSFESKKAIYRDPSIYKKWADLHPDQKINIDELKCRNLKYTQGDDQLQMGLTVGGFLVGGLGTGALLKKSASAVYKNILPKLQMTRFSTQGAQVVLYTSMSMASPNLLMGIHQDCLSERPSLLNQSQSSCQLKDPEQQIQFEYAQMDEQNCLINSATNLIPELAPLALYLKNKKFFKNPLKDAGLPFAKDRRVNNPDSENFKNVRHIEDIKTEGAEELNKRWSPIVKKYKSLEVASEEENTRFTHFSQKLIHKHDTKGEESFAAVLDVENWDMKNLNSKLPKDVVTSFNHMFFAQLKTRFKDFQKAFPDYEPYFYSDYKSTRLALDGAKNPKEQKALESMLQKMYEQELQKYLDEIKKKKLLRSDDANDMVENWFKASTCNNPGVGNLATRALRGLSRSVSSCNDPEVQKILMDKERNISIDRKNFQTQFGDTDLMDAVTGTNKKVFTTEVTQLARKSKTDEELLKNLKYQFPNENISIEDAKKIKEHIQNIDSFSPPTYQLKRELSVIDDDAVHGAFTLDFVGQGGRNIRSTAEALAQNEDLRSLEKIASQTDKNLQLETQVLQADRQKLGTITDSSYAKICSGDDCEGVPNKAWTREERIQLTSAVREKFTLPTRATFSTGKNVDGTTRKSILTDGEELEKNFITHLKKIMPYEQLKKFDFLIELDGKQVLQGKIDLILSPSNATEFKNKTQVDKIKKAFEQSLAEMRGVFKEMHPGINGEYQLGEVLYNFN